MKNKIKRPEEISLLTRVSSATEILNRLKAGSLTIGFADLLISASETENMMKTLGISGRKLGALKSEVQAILGNEDNTKRVNFTGKFSSGKALAERVEAILSDFDAFREDALNLARKLRDKQERKMAEINENRPAAKSFGLVKHGRKEYFCAIDSFVDGGEWSSAFFEISESLKLRVFSEEPHFLVYPIIQRDGSNENSKVGEKRKVKPSQIKEVPESEIVLAFLERLHSLVQP
jgi:hypothetical protein